MNSEESTVTRKRAKPARPDRKPKRLPPYAVIVYNDDLHTFAYVIETFRKVFGYAPERCQQLAWQIHAQGKGIVWSGPKEVAELKRDQIRGAGPDFYATQKVNFPLGVTIEPLPQ
jgi:ATP-dependent Clp protease adaptor protein ClpS